MKFGQIIIAILLVAVLVVGISVWQPWKGSVRTVEVTGEGKVKAEPDVSKITAGVQTEKSTSDEAQKEASVIIKRVVGAVKSKGILDKDIQTQTVSTLPKYEYNPSGKSTIAGYNGKVAVTVTIRDTSKEQEILDAATGAGATFVYGPQLTFSDKKLAGLKIQAQEKAVKDARENAKQLAANSGAKIGKIINLAGGNISYRYKYSGMSYDSAKLLAESSSGRSIYAGEDEITVSVTVKFSLK